MERATYAMALADRYDLIEPPIGEGSFGAVYLAQDRKMPRKVAVKVLHASYASDAKVSARFLRELVAACRVSHENVIQVLDVGDDDEHGLFYVMEYAEGVSLEERLDGKPMGWAALRVLALQLAAALHAIHTAGIVHRDLKPRNIMLVERASQDDLVKVLDFGIAVIHDGDFAGDVELTGTRMVVGTPPYMSPEQTYMKSDRQRLGLEVDGRSDLYALGVILYEMLVGGRPFTGDAHELALAHRHDVPADPKPLAAADIPTGFFELVMRLLAKTPNQRPASAEQVLASIRSLASSSPGMVSPKGIQQDAQDAATCIVDAPSARIQDADTLMASALPSTGGTVVEPTSELVAEALGRPQRAWRWAVLASALILGAWWWALEPVPGPQVDEGAEAVVAPAAAVEDTAQSPTKAHLDVTPPVGKRAADNMATAVSLMVTSVPPGAEVLVDGVVIGETPLATTLDARAQAKHLLEVQLAGYRLRQIPIAVAPHLAGKALVFNETLEADGARRKALRSRKAPRTPRVTPKSRRSKDTKKAKAKSDPLGGI